VISRRAFLTATAASAVSLSAGPGRAQSYPNKLIKMILPYTAGSPNDVLARLVTPALSAQLGQTIVLENRPGGGTSIAVRAVMTAEPDGYTLLFSNSPVHFIAPVVSKTFTYDPLKDFVPIACVGTTSNVLVVIPSVPAKTLAEFIAYAKANPGKLNFGYGQGTLPQLIGALFKQETGVEFASIPYKGGAQAVTDMLGGQIHMNLGTPSTLLPLIRDGRLRALAVTSTERSPDLPEVPTMTESGLPNVTTTSYYGVFGPAGLPAEIVNRINTAASDGLKSPELTARMVQAGFGLKGGSPQDYASLIAAEMRKWIPVVTATGFQME
jgi:tripartite-type tricarboxylate transporter receptor subunit TctC